MADPRAQLGPLLKLVGPLVVSEFGVLLMTSVDVAMVSPLGKADLGAFALGTFYASTLTLFAIHILDPLEVIVARAVGAKKPEDAGSAFRSAIPLALLIAVPTILLLCLGGPILSIFVGGGHADAPDLVSRAASFSRWLAIGTPGLLLYYTSRLFVEAHSRPIPGMIIMILGNVLNVGGNLLLIPQFGAKGSALSTSIVQLVMAIATLVYIRSHSELRVTIGMRPTSEVRRARMKEIFKLGLPLSLRSSLRELSTLIMLVLVGTYGTTQLDGTTIAFTVFRLASPFMGGVFWASCIVLSRDFGKKDMIAMRRQYWLSMQLSATLGVLVAAVLLLFARPIASAYTSDPSVMEAAISTLHVLGILYFFVTLQTSASAGLVGLLDTKFIAKVGIGGVYGLALPLAWVLAQPLALGPTVVWYGRWASDFVIALVFVGRFLRLHSRKTAELAQ